MDTNYKPSERQKNCRYSFLYSGEKMNRTACMKKMDESENSGREEYVTNENCEACECYNSRYIEYPIQVNSIETEKLEGIRMYASGCLVQIKPCAEEYKGKTYLGLYLGDLPWMSNVSYNEDEKILNVGAIHNPAIYVFSLKKIIFGAESWWCKIDSPEGMKDISEEDINNTWYVKLLKAMCQEEI